MGTNIQIGDAWRNSVLLGLSCSYMNSNWELTFCLQKPAQGNGLSLIMFASSASTAIMFLFPNVLLLTLQSAKWHTKDGSVRGDWNCHLTHHHAGLYIQLQRQPNTKYSLACRKTCAGKQDGNNCKLSSPPGNQGLFSTGMLFDASFCLSWKEMFEKVEGRPRRASQNESVQKETCWKLHWKPGIDFLGKEADPKSTRLQYILKWTVHRRHVESYNFLHQN